MRVIYAMMLVWVVGAFIYICARMIEQHHTLAELSAIRAESEGWQQQEQSLLGRERVGLLFVLQEMQQKPESNIDFRTGRALQKAGGRFHPPLTEEEKSAVRKLISLAEARIINYLDGIGGKLDPAQAGFALLAGQMVAKYEQDARVPFPRAPVAAAALGKIAAGEEVSEDAAKIFQLKFENVSGRIDRWIAGEALELYPEERQLIAQVLEYCTQLPQGNEALEYLATAIAGLEKLAGKSTSECTGGETSALTKLCNDATRSNDLPADKLKKWLDDDDVEFSDDEKKQLLAAADEAFRRYEDSQARLADTVVKFVTNLRDAKSRFIVYEVYEDKEKRAKASVFTLIFALWQKIDDKVMMVDMVEIAGSRNKYVRDDMVKALVTVGEPAIVPLLRSVRRDKVDPALAAKTKDRLKHERLRELNETNKIIRLSCMRALGGIGGPNAKRTLAPLVDEDDPDISAAAEKALRASP